MNIHFLILLTYTLFYCLVNILLGLCLLKLFFKSHLVGYSSTIVLTTSFLLGQGILFGCWQLLGVFGYFKIIYIWLAIIAIIFLSFPVWRDLFWLAKKTIKSFKVEFINLPILWKCLLIFVLLLISFFALGSIILPPSGDAEAFYMVLPKMMADTGILKPQPNYYEFSKIGLFGEMHMAALMVLAGQSAAKFFVWFTALAVGILLVSIGSLFNMKTKGKIIVLALLFTSSTFTNYITDGKIDVFSAAFGIAAYYWVLQFKGKNWQPIALVGLFLSYAIISKLSNLIVILPGILLVLVWNNYLDSKLKGFFRINFLKKMLISFLILGIFFSIGLIPHLIKNKILFNDPLGMSNKYSNFQWVYPIWSATKILYTFSRPTPVPSTPTPVFTSTPTPIEEVTPVPTPTSQLAPLPPPPPPVNRIDYGKIRNGLITLATYPFAFVFGNRPGQGGNLSVLMIAFLPFIFFLRPFKLVQKQILAMALLGLFIWLIVRSSATTPRYILPTLLLFIPIIAGGTEVILNQGKYVFLKFIAVCSIFFFTLVFLFIHFNMFLWFSSAVLGRSNPSTYYGPYYPGLAHVNQVASSQDRVFLVGYYGYFLDGDLLPNIDNNQEKLDIVFYRHPKPWEYIYDKGFKYVVVQKAPHLIVEDDLKNIRPEWLDIKQIYSDPITDVFSLEKKQ